MNQRSRLWGHFQPLSVALIYGVLASLWIVLSDRAVGWLFDDPVMLVLASTVKGWLFVGVTTALVFVLLLRRERPAPGANPPQGSLPWWGLALLGALVVGATGLAINHVWRTEREQAGLQLLTISQSKARELALWHAERLREARWLQADKDLAIDWLVLQRTQAPSALTALGQRLDGYLLDGHFRRVSLLRADGAVVWHSGGATLSSEAPLMRGLQEVLAQRSPLRVGPWQDATGQTRLAFLVPLALEGEPSAVVVLHVDPSPHVHPTLASWPVPAKTAEAFLFRREGDQVQFLSVRKHAPSGPDSALMPLNTPQLFSAQVLLGNAQPGTVLDAVDYRNEQALAVARPIEGTDWWLLARQDRVEVMGDEIGRASCRGRV